MAGTRTHKQRRRRVVTKVTKKPTRHNHNAYQYFKKLGKGIPTWAYADAPKAIREGLAARVAAAEIPRQPLERRQAARIEALEANLRDAAVQLDEAMKGHIAVARMPFSIFRPPFLPDFATLVAAEVQRARTKHSPTHSPHEGHSIIEEEFDEYWDDVKADKRMPALREPVQLAAMCDRVANDVYGVELELLAHE